MRDLEDVLADLSDGVDDGETNAHLYSTLAPVYDFIYERHFDYNDQLALVTETVPDDAASVLEVGCGTGRLLTGLASEYGEAVGVEQSEAMAHRACRRADEAEVVVGDATRSLPEGQFDAVVALGRVTGHVIEDGSAERLFRNCFDALGGDDDSIADSGVLLFDYFPTERMEDDYRTTDSFESERYRVDRVAHSTIPERDSGPDLVETTFDYEILDRETGESATVSETMALRMFSHNEVRGLLGGAGFAEVEIHEEGADGWPLAVAQKGRVESPR